MIDSPCSATLNWLTFCARNRIVGALSEVRQKCKRNLYIHRLAEEFNLDPNLLRYACDKLEEESRRPMTLKAVVKYVLNRPVIEGSADVVARIFQRYFEHLYETSPV